MHRQSCASLLSCHVPSLGSLTVTAESRGAKNQGFVMSLVLVKGPADHLVRRGISILLSLSPAEWSGGVLVVMLWGWQDWEAPEVGAMYTDWQFVPIMRSDGSTHHRCTDILNLSLSLAAPFSGRFLHRSSAELWLPNSHLVLLSCSIF